MKKILRSASIIGVAICLLSAANNASEVVSATKDLKSADLLAVRSAIRKLGELSKAANVPNAVQPLTDIMTQKGRSFDYYTRSLAAQSLGLIARDMVIDQS